MRSLYLPSEPRQPSFQTVYSGIIRNEGVKEFTPGTAELMTVISQRDAFSSTAGDGPKCSARIAPGLIRSPATHKHNCFSLWLLRNDGALKCLAVLNDVVLGSKRWNSRADDNKNDGEGRDFH